jgi:hypothetical protein
VVAADRLDVQSITRFDLEHSLSKLDNDISRFWVNPRTRANDINGVNASGAKLINTNRIGLVVDFFFDDGQKDIVSGIRNRPFKNAFLNSGKKIFHLAKESGSAPVFNNIVTNH